MCARNPSDPRRLPNQVLRAWNTHTKSVLLTRGYIVGIRLKAALVVLSMAIFAGSFGLIPFAWAAQTGFFWSDIFVGDLEYRYSNEEGLQFYQYTSYPSYSSSNPSFPSAIRDPSYASYPSPHNGHNPLVAFNPVMEGYRFLANTDAELQAGTFTAQHALAIRATHLCKVMNGKAPSRLYVGRHSQIPGIPLTLLTAQADGSVTALQAQTSSTGGPTYISSIICFE